MRNVRHPERGEKKGKELVTPVEKKCRRAGSSANTLCHVSLHLEEVEKRVSALIIFPFLWFRPVATGFLRLSRIRTKSRVHLSESPTNRRCFPSPPRTPCVCSDMC